MSLHFCLVSSLVQTLHRGFDVSCYSTHKITLIRGAYSPFTHGTRVRHACSTIVRCSQVRQTLSLSIPRQAARRTTLEPSYTRWALARETWAGLCRSLVALLLSRRAVRNEGRPPSPCWVRQSLQAYCRQRRGTPSDWGSRCSQRVKPWRCGHVSARGEPWGELARLDSGSSCRDGNHL
jgi:hypothetical protein